MNLSNNAHLRRYLAQAGMLSHLVYESFELAADRFERALSQVRAQHPYLDDAEAAARAAYRVIAPAQKKNEPKPRVRKRLGIRFWIVIAAIVVAGLLAGLLCTRLRAEPTPQPAAGRQAILHATRGMNLLPQQPNGIILQFQQGGSPLATRPAGLVVLNCSTNMTCSWSGNTFTLTSSGGAGSGCTPSGGTANAFLYDTGSGTCDDISKITWNSGTSTGTVATGGLLTYSGTGIINARQWASTGITNAESLGKIPIGNGNGTATWSDPFVSGITAHDAVGTSTNPVLIGGYANAAAPSDVSADGDAVRAWLLRNGAQVFNLASGGTLVTLGQKAMSSSLPVAIASDQSAVPVSGTFWQATQPVSGTVTANQGGSNWSANVAQFGGTNVVTGTGASGAGIPRVTVANDSNILATQSGNWTARTVGNSGAAMDAAGQNASSPANELLAACQFNTTPTTISSGNVSPEQCDSKGSRNVDLQTIAGTAVDVNSGNKSAGTQRNVLATDSPAIANWGQGATGSAVPSGAQQIGGVGSGNLTAPLNCDGYAFYDAATNGATQLVALTSSQTIYVCGYSFSSSSTTANTLKLVYGTGTNCATGQTAMTPGTILQAATSVGPIGKVVPVSGWSRGLKTAASNALCVLTNAAAAAQVEVWYTKF